MPDVSRSDSQRSDSSQRPRVSFNRDVRIKRIGRPEGSVVTAVTSDGEGHLVPTTVRRERGQGSRSQTAREAALVLRHADSVNCIPVMDTSLRKSTIPKRNTKDPANQIKINDTTRRKLTRSVSDAGSRHDRSKYGPGKSYWSENEGEDSASSEGGRQKLRKQEEKRINIFATLNNRLRGKKKKKSSDLDRSEIEEDRRPNTPTRRNDTGIDVVSNLKTENSKSKSIENLLPEAGGYQEKKSQLTQTSTLPRRSKNSKKQLSPIIEDEPIASNPRRSPFDFNNQDRRLESIHDDMDMNSAPKIVIEPPTPIYEVDEKIFTSSRGRSDQASRKDNKVTSSLIDSSGRDSRSSIRMEEEDGRKLVDKNDKARLSSILDYRKNEHGDKKHAVENADDLSSRTIKDDKKKRNRSKPKTETKSRSKFYDNEEWISSEEEFSLAHDNGHYKSYDYGLLDPDLSLTNIDEIRANNNNMREGKQIEVIESKTSGVDENDSGFMLKGTVGRKFGNDKWEGEERLSNVRKNELKRTSSLNVSPERRLFTGVANSSAKNEVRMKEDAVFRGENSSQKKVDGRNSLSRRFFEKERRGSLQGVGDEFDKHNATETSTRKPVTSDEEMSRKTVGMLVEELSRKQSAKRRKDTLHADKLKSVGALIDPLLDLDRQHNNNKPFSYTDPYKSPPPLLAAVSVDAKQQAVAPTDEVIYAEVICTPAAAAAAAKVGGNVGVGGNSSFLERAGHPSTDDAGLAAATADDNAEFGVSREPSGQLATSIRSPRELVHKIRKETDSAPPKSHKTTVHTIVKRTTTTNPPEKVSSVKLNEPDGSDNSYLPGKQPNNDFLIETNVNQNFRKTKKGSTVDLNRTSDNSTNNYNHYTSPNLSNNDSNRKNLGSDHSSVSTQQNSSVSETNSTVEYTNDYSIKSGKITKKDSKLNKDSSVDALGYNNASSNSGKKVVTKKEYLVDDYTFSPIVEEIREDSSFVEKNRHHQSSPSLYFSKSERDLTQEEIEGKRDSIIRIDVEEEEEFGNHQNSFGSKSLKMNTTARRSMSSDKMLSGDINDLSLRRHRLESIIDSHKRRFENRAISPNRYSRTLTRSVSNVSPSYRNSNRLIEDDLSSATKKTIKEDRYFERHIKRTASNYKDKDMLSDGAPLKIEADDSYRTNRNGRNDYKNYNYYLKNDSKNNEKFNNEYNLTNSIRDNKYRSSDNVADIYRNEESNNESNGTKYGKKHFREWYTSMSVKKTERGSGDDASYGYGSLKGEKQVKDEGRNSKVLRSDGKYPSLREDSNRIAAEDGKDNRVSDSGRSSRGGFFEKLRSEQKSSSKTSSAKDSRKVSGLEKVRRKLSNWNSGKKNSTQDKTEKKDKKKKTKDENVHGSSLEEQRDLLTSRYSEYKGEEGAEDERGYGDHMARESDYYATRQRVSTPETDPTWFRSLDRVKHKTSHSRLSGEDTVDRKHRPVSRANSTSQKNLRFFGESDSGSYPSLNTSHLQVPSNRTSSRLRSSLDSSAESTLEEDSGHSQKSVVYLHAATIGDIPGSRKLHRSQITGGRRSMSREELSSNKTDSTFVPHKRTLSRSISVLAPWRPRHPRDGIEVNYNDAGKPPRAPIKINNRTLTRLQQQENKRRPQSSAGGSGRDSRSDRRGSDERSTGVSDNSTTNHRRRKDASGSETDLARSKSVPRSSKLSSGWFRGK